MLALSTLGTWMGTQHREDCPDIGPICQVRAEPPQLHDQSIGLFELRLRAEYGVADGWGVATWVPFRVFSTRIRYLNLAGQPVQLDYPNIHHRNETLAGPGDVWLLGHFSRRLESFGPGWGRWQIDARAGLSLPTGRTVPDPFALGRQGIPHEHFQFGTGTVNPIVGAEVRRDFARFGLSAWGLSQLVFYQNGHGYQAGNRYAGGLYASSPLGTARWNFRLGAEVQAESAERWHGQVPTTDGNRGRIDVLAVGGADLQLGARWSLLATVRVPTYIHVASAQLGYPALFELGLSRSIDLLPHRHHPHHHHHHGPKGEEAGEPGHDDDHGRDQGPGPDPGPGSGPDPVPGQGQGPVPGPGQGSGPDPGPGQGSGPGPDRARAQGRGGEAGRAPAFGPGRTAEAGLDLSDVVKAGEDRELRPVAGKLTVFDFWAAFCAPCRDLDRRLRRLLSRTPALAVRRVNIVDWDSPIARRYLGRAPTLPHLKVFGPDGRLLFEASGSPEELIARLERILAAP